MIKGLLMGFAFLAIAIVMAVAFVHIANGKSSSRKTPEEFDVFEQVK